MARQRIFVIEGLELEAADRFIAEHEAKHGDDRSSIGGRYTYACSPTSIGLVVKGPPAIAADASALRRPSHPISLLEAGEPSKHPSERLLASRPIRTKRSE